MSPAERERRLLAAAAEWRLRTAPRVQPEVATDDPPPAPARKWGGSKPRPPALCVVDHCPAPRKVRGYCKKHYAAFWNHGPNLKPPAKEPRPCSGCGADIVPSPRERNARKWCSPACRSRTLYPARRDAGLAHYPRIKVRYGDCATCGAFICRRSTGGELVCGHTCRAALNAKRQRARYASDPASEVERLREVRAQRTDEQVAADAARIKAYKARVGRLESTKAGEARRRARLLSLPTEKFLHVDVFERDGWACGICSAPVDRALKHPHPLSPSLDHIQPLSLGGPHVMANTRLAHLSCNVRRGNRVEEVSDAG